jgi:protein O-mannosyl-transferase
MISPLEQPNAQNRSLVLGCLLLFTFLIYANTLLNGFLYDDHPQIENNPYIHSFKYLGKIFGSHIEGAANYYRPLMMFGFLVDFHLFGASPYGYHLVNVLLHCAVVWLVYEVSAGLFSDQWIGFVAGFLFALHPIHTESVDWVSAITDIQLTFFYLLTFWLFLGLAGENENRKARVHAGLLLSFILALLSKEQAMTLPMLATIYEHFYRLDRSATSLRTKFSRYGGLWIAGLAYVVVRVFATGRLSPVLQHADLTRVQTLLTAVALFGRYLSKLVWPFPLVAFQAFQKSVALSDPHVMFGLALIAVFGLLFALLWRRARLYSFALLWILFGIVPVLDARWMAANVFAERYLYLPSVGFCWLAGGAILWLWRKSLASSVAPRALAASAFALVALLAAGSVIARNRDWRDDRTLIVHTLKTGPESAGMRFNLGLIEWYEGNHADAERQWHLALEDQPDFPEALSELGFAYLQQKNYDQAFYYLNRVIALKPQFATPHIYLGHAYDATGDRTHAEAEFRRAIALQPLNGDAHRALGHFYLAAGRLDEAKAEFLAALDIRPDPETWSAMGEIYGRLNQTELAADAWRNVLVFRSFDPRAHRSLGLIYLARGQIKPAEKEFEACLLMNPHDEEALAGLQKIRAAGVPSR